MLDKNFKHITEDSNNIYFMNEKIPKKSLSKNLIQKYISKYSTKYDP